MLNAVLQYIYGPRSYNWPIKATYQGEYQITEGCLDLPFLLHGQCFRILGSALNDGVYQYGEALSLSDEIFQGTVWALAVPKPVLDLTKEIQEWETKNGAIANGPYQSESFAGEYSYTKAADSATGGAVTWQTAFRSRLNSWRKI